MLSAGDNLAQLVLRCCVHLIMIRIPFLFSIRVLGPVGVALALTILFLSPIINMDIWWHLDSGRWMLEHHAYLDKEVRSYSLHGLEWHNFAWLFQVSVAWVAQMAGGWGLLLFKGLLWVVIFSLLFSSMGRSGAPLSWLLAFFLLSWQTLPTMFLRPHLFEGVFLAVLLALLQREPRRGDLGWYALLVVLWANSHASVVVGTAALLLHYLFGTRFRWPGMTRLRQAWPGMLLLGSLVFASPNGLALLDVLGGHARGEQMYAYIREWLPPESLPPFLFVVLLAVLGGALLKRDLLKPAELLLIACFVVLSHGSKRFLFELALVLMRPAAVLLGWLLERIARGLPHWSGRHGWMIGSLLLLALLSSYVPPLPWRVVNAGDYPVALRRYPHVAMAVLQPVLDGEQTLRIWNPYGWGGYVGWRGQGRAQVFIDGRTPTLFSEEMLLQTNLSHRKPVMLRSLAARWQVGAILLHRVVPLPIPPADPVWFLVAYDDASLLYLRADLAVRYGFRSIDFDPFNPAKPESFHAAQQRVAQLQKLLNSDAQNVLAWQQLAEYLGVMYQFEPSGLTAQAILDALTHAIDQAPDQVASRLRLSQWLQRLGRSNQAVLKPLIPAIWRLPDAALAGQERAIAQVLLKADQPRAALKVLYPAQWQRHQLLDRDFESWLLRLQAYLDLEDWEHARKVNAIAAWMALDADPVARRRYRALLTGSR